MCLKGTRICGICVRFGMNQTGVLFYVLGVSEFLASSIQIEKFVI